MGCGFGGIGKGDTSPDKCLPYGLGDQVVTGRRGMYIVDEEAIEIVSLGSKWDVEINDMGAFNLVIEDLLEVIQLFLVPAHRRHQEDLTSQFFRYSDHFRKIFLKLLGRDAANPFPFASALRVAVEGSGHQENQLPE